MQSLIKEKKKKKETREANNMVRFLNEIFMLRFGAYDIGIRATVCYE